MNELLKRIEGVISEHQQQIKDDDNYFNVFSILQLGNDELFHSALLSELLCPNGKHLMSDFFLEQFIIQISENETIKNKLSETQFDTKSAQVITEKVIANGRIDIFLVDKNDKKIIIENKLNADDQENQIERYFDYGNKDAIILYLNKFGTDPKSKSTNLLKKNVDFFVISYEKHIINWLKNSMYDLKSEVIKANLKQYVELLKTITHQTSYNKLKQKVMLEIKENMRAAYEISQNFEEARKQLIDNFWEEMRTTATKKLNNKNKNWLVDTEKIAGRDNEPFYFRMYKPEWKDKVYVYCAGVYSKVFYGITTIEQNGLNALDVNKKLNDEYNLLNTRKPTTWSVFWDYKHEFNFADINCLDNISNEENRNAQVNALSEFLVTFCIENEKLCDNIYNLLTGN